MAKKIRVLLVDDDEDEYILTSDLLLDRSYYTDQTEPVGFELDWVATYENALAEIEKQEHDIYLVDYNLGERNGLELVKAATSKGCLAPIILLTGQGSYQVDIEAMKAGAMDYLVKGEVNAALLERSIRYSIERRRAEEKIRKNAERAELLATLSHTFAEAGLDYPEILDVITLQIAESTGDASVIRLISSDKQWLDPVAYHHTNPEILASLRDLLASVRFRADTGPEGKVLKSGHPRLFSKRSVQAEGANARPNGWPWPKEYAFESALLVPLRVKDRLIGTLGLLRPHSPVPYNSEDLFFYQDLADRAALAIENARLYAAEALRVLELNALNRATAALLSTIDLDTLLSRILDIAQDAIPVAGQALLHLAVSDTGELQIREASNHRDPRIKKIRFAKNESCSAEALEDKLPMLISDTRATPDLSGTCFAETGLPGEIGRSRSAVIAPLILGSDLLGLISVVASQPAVFTEADKDLLMSFANTTTAALRNAMLHAEVQRLAITDSLTEVFNRRGFFDLGRREIERALRFSRSLSAILIDLDNFKEINDRYGHAVGDQVLHFIADRLRASIREVDILGRYGGDEFIILLPETDALAASAAAERVRSRLAEPIEVEAPLSATAEDQIQITITASMGIASVNERIQDLASLMAQADAAAYAAKQRGKNRIEID